MSSAAKGRLSIDPQDPGLKTQDTHNLIGVDFSFRKARNVAMAAMHTDSIGRYRMVGTLGQGAMGRVYLADDPGLGMKVAIKFIKRDNMLENEVILSRFKREAVLGARIQHPNIVAIYDVGLDANHGPYMVMEYVDGQELIAILREGKASTPEILDWLRQTAGALQCAHRAGIIHRDVKPANILVSREGQAKLIDFGVARVMGPERPGKPGVIGERLEPAEDEELLSDKHATAWGLLSSSEGLHSDEPHLEVLDSHGEDHPSGDSEGLTQVGSLIGTPSYTAPELLQDAQPCPETDLYAFAVTAFQAMFGHLPFRGRGTRETLERILLGGPEFLAEPEPKLRAVFEKALALDPQKRFPTFEAFMDELYVAHDMKPQPLSQRLVQTLSLAKSALVAPKADTTQKLPNLASARRHVLPWVKWLGGGLGVLLVLGLGLRWWLASGDGLDEITVHTEPSGTSVYVDGQYLGQAPLDNVTLPERGHKLLVAKKHYKSIERELHPEDGFVSLLLELAPYDLKIETNPSGAQILLDDKQAGTSPTVLKHIQGSGSHTLELRLPGYVSNRIRLDPLKLPKGPILLAPENPSASEIFPPTENNRAN